jgi:cytochrome b561
MADQIKDASFEQMKLVYDYIKFHLGLYLATPPVFVVVAEAFHAKELILFQIGLVGMILIYGLSGIHAGLFMGRYINTRWTEQVLDNFNREAYTNCRRNWHHTLYWIGLAIGGLFLIAAVTCKYISGPPGWFTKPVI